ncbi:DUF1499 domain-containing protein [Jiella sp. M17.18]|uniref:DUF1499 domain-containing protein n=1 Tax=Jiella sp. M17.18 TaxID=3234247 RepID=UPI0034DEF750
MRTLLRILVLLVLAGAIVSGGFLVIGPSRVWEWIGGPADQGPVDFAALTRRSVPNDALACSPGLCRGLTVDLTLPAYSAAPAALMYRLDRAALHDGNVARVDNRSRPNYRRYVARTKLLQFPDTVDAEAVASPDGTGLRLYSRSLLGRGDFGANRARLEAWIARLGDGQPAPSG